MICELRNLRCGLRPREIAMRFERHINLRRDAFCNLVKALRYPVARLVTLHAWLDLVRKNTNQWSAEFRCEFSMGHCDADLISSLSGVRRMKRAGSINTADLD